MDASYREYLLSEAWMDKKLGALQWADERCQVCNNPHDLAVHHRTYERIMDEDPADLTVLCSDCHSLFHQYSRLVK